MGKPRKVYHKDGWRVEVVGELNVQVLAEYLLILMRREKFNGEIKPEKRTETSETKNLKNKKE
ncbi:hypothetical protein [Bacillus thuringiensis]|uniref:hypothetical protein n=1 Tax=Bacillus thuringiensis TaxID=1428 RepID=UPI0026E28966|nr:hypothetical protein [Bacillus thuringiensis]MDO6629017.1 hypothetical protein [Bacillus thuringiensis]MDO6659455.1 hypothetical protein [Bacillus thuringiensis]MDO6699199.1 hypothetical protein [Bacillus thuringiensis]